MERGRFDAGFVAAELAKDIEPLPNGVTRFSGTALFGEPLVLLETGIEFLKPISDMDKSLIIDRALKTALRAPHYTPSALIREVNEATRDFVRSPETAYVMVTGLSFEYCQDLTKVERSGYRLYVRRELPRRFVKAHEEAKRRSKKYVHGDYPEERTHKSYAAAWMHVRGRSPWEAMQRALETLELRRGIWNFVLNRGIGPQLPAPVVGPFNHILAGPIYSLHHPDGSLATHLDWFEPQYMGPKFSRRVHQKWDQVCKNEESILRILRRSPYTAELEEALRRYCRALDLVELSSSFLNLWSLLETLTGIGPGDSHDKVVKRASFLYADPQRKTHELVLQHLRRFRNSYVHLGEGYDQASAYLYQLRRYVEDMLAFHLQTSRGMGSHERLVQFLDLSADIDEIHEEMATQKLKAGTTKEAARLAEKGFRFRLQEQT